MHDRDPPQHAPGRHIEALQRLYPWPEQPPDLAPTTWGWGIAGATLLRQHLPPEARCILEIGSLLGASARFFAAECPAAHLICVDPWNDQRDRPLLRHAPELAPILNDCPNGLYQLFLASNWALRARIVPLRGYSPEALRIVYDAGIAPDFIYIDASHYYEDVLLDLHCCQLLFPHAIVSGDDWSWPGVRDAVGYFARLRGYTVLSEANTWVVQVPPGGGDRTEAAIRAAPAAPSRLAAWRARWSRLGMRKRR